MKRGFSKKSIGKNNFLNKNLFVAVSLIIISILIVGIFVSVAINNNLQIKSEEKNIDLVSERIATESEQLKVKPEEKNAFLNTLNNIFTFLETLAGIPAAISCTTDANCPSGQVCAHGNCVLAVEAPCTIATEDTDCPDGQQCGDGICVPGCLTNDQCGGGLICNGHSCVGCDSAHCVDASYPGNVWECLPGDVNPHIKVANTCPGDCPSNSDLSTTLCPTNGLGQLWNSICGCSSSSVECCESGCCATCDPSIGTCPCPGYVCAPGSIPGQYGCVKNIPECTGTVCTPDCTGKVCGDDGCGGSCGSCDDGIACTTDSCDPATGTCLHPLTGCDDSNLCTTDSCNADGTCSN
ncbi:MAG: hypothetical protein PHF67_03455, partial [Candidatus Nanoarchaeia archaeon]|nr:hypothetical protein [Candidatus Nanoarchaeia archaeon]